MSEGPAAGEVGSGRTDTGDTGGTGSDRTELFDLRVTVERIDGRGVCGVYSRDVAALVEEKLLHLLSDSSPVHSAAMSLSLGPREARFRNIDDGIDYLERRLDESVTQVSSVLAIDSLDAWLALGGGTAEGT